ncbi:MAG: hypothetical protein RL329_249 [Bacteroidota bacterium]|jgi:hypothetical protein
MCFLNTENLSLRLVFNQFIITNCNDIVINQLKAIYE